MAVQAKVIDKREHDRGCEPAIRLQIGSKVYRSINWSLGGVLIEEYEGNLSIGSLLSITEIGLDHGVMSPVKIHARVTRADAESNSLAIQMLEIDHSAYAILSKLLARKL